MAKIIAFSIDGEEPILEDIFFESAKEGDWVCNEGMPMGFGRIVKKDDNFIVIDRDPLYEIHSNPIGKDVFDKLKLKRILNAINIYDESD
jgi:hypothetical protein